uniref:Uncharacterized protein n=1 Tax=Opuntia streptacantha TaxID=393608 RepID=A0A7C9DAD8_OPUST
MYDRQIQRPTLNALQRLVPILQMIFHCLWVQQLTSGELQMGTSSRRLEVTRLEQYTAGICAEHFLTCTLDKVQSQSKQKRRSGEMLLVLLGDVELVLLHYTLSEKWLMCIF